VSEREVFAVVGTLAFAAFVCAAGFAIGLLPRLPRFFIDRVRPLGRRQLIRAIRTIDRLRSLWVEVRTEARSGDKADERHNQAETRSGPHG